VATELIVPPGSPQAAVLKEGTEVIVAVINAGAPATPARGGMGPRPPF
jgi:hypothetical protein